MKKLIAVLAIGTIFTYCNPSQQSSQSTIDSSAMGDSMMLNNSGNSPDSTDVLPH